MTIATPRPTVTVGVHQADGRSIPAVTKQFPPALITEGLWEADWFRRVALIASPPMAPRLVDVGPDRLVLDHVPGPTLASLDPTPFQAAQILSVLALTVARLHRHDLSHGNLDVDHILCRRAPASNRADRGTVADGWTPLLCSPNGGRSMVDDRTGLVTVAAQVGALAALGHSANATNRACGQCRRDWEHLVAELEGDQTLGAARLAARFGAWPRTCPHRRRRLPLFDSESVDDRNRNEQVGVSRWSPRPGRRGRDR